MTIPSSLFLSTDLFSDTIQKVAIRDGFGDGLVTAGEENQNVVVLTADLKESTRAQKFAERFPERFFDCGVAEQGMVTVASGLANAGKIPFICSYSVFNPGRTWEQIRTTICLNNVPVKIYGGHVGVSVGQDGATHQMLEDIALMRTLPNMIVVAPSDAIEAQKAVIAAMRIERPVYIRSPKIESSVYTTSQTPFEIGKANVLTVGNDVTLIACGGQVYTALLAAKELEQQHIQAEVINLHTIKPLDAEAILNSARKTHRVVTVEDHQIAGGMGSAVCELLAQEYPTKVIRMGINDVFGQSGKTEELYQHYGLTVTDIVNTVRKMTTY